MPVLLDQHRQHDFDMWINAAEHDRVGAAGGGFADQRGPPQRLEIVGEFFAT